MTGHIASIVRKQREMEAAGYSYFRFGSSLRERVFCLSVCLCTACMQYPLRPEEGSNSPELKLSGPPAEQSALLTAEQALESRDIYFRHLDSLDQGDFWVCLGVS